MPRKPPRIDTGKLRAALAKAGYGVPDAAWARSVRVATHTVVHSSVWLSDLPLFARLVTELTRLPARVGKAAVRRACQAVGVADRPSANQLGSTVGLSALLWDKSENAYINKAAGVKFGGDFEAECVVCYEAPLPNTPWCRCDHCPYALCIACRGKCAECPMCRARFG